MNVFTMENMLPLFSFLDECMYTEQLKTHHPEGNVLNHSLQVFEIACKESNDTDLIMAGLLHDVGKSEDVRGHDQIAITWLYDYCSVKTLFLIQHHMRIKKLLSGEIRRQGKVEFLINHSWLPELIILCRWDNMGRHPYANPPYNKDNIIEKLNEKVALRFDK